MVVGGGISEKDFFRQCQSEESSKQIQTPNTHASRPHIRVAILEHGEMS